MKKILLSSVIGQMRMEFARNLLEFAGDTLQEMTKKPEMEVTKQNNQPREKEEINNELEW